MPAAFHRYIQSTCATSGEGLYEGLDWLSSNIASKRCGVKAVHHQGFTSVCLNWGHGSETRAVYSRALCFPNDTSDICYFFYLQCFEGYNVFASSKASLCGQDHMQAKLPTLMTGGSPSALPATSLLSSALLRS